MSDEYNLPNVTATMINDYVGQCRNLGLILDKYPPQQVIGSNQSISGWLRQLRPSTHIDTKLAQAAFERWHRMIRSIEGVQHFSASTDWRMVIGLGGDTVLETDITLHHLYGIPFIPGSALKGLTRAYVTGEVYPSTKIEEDNEIVKQIFGTQKEAGTVIFFDAMPIDGDVTIALDIMNPHYPDYYSKGIAPTNDQSPVPVTFLAVEDTTFMFAVAPRNPKDERHKQDVEHVKVWLQEALQKYGIGGKTSAGYGVLKPVNATEDDEEPVDLNDPEMQVADALIAEINELSGPNQWNQIEQKYFRRLRDMKSPRAQSLVAKAIIEKARQAGIEQQVSGRPLYKVIQGYLNKK